jgi:hypothetical protein
MKEKREKKEPPADNDLDFSCSELYDNQEFIANEDEEDNFYSFSGDDYFDPDRDRIK